MSQTESAADLIAAAQAATTDAELDAIQAQAEGRVTVESAVAERRAYLAEHSETVEQPTSAEPLPESQGGGVGEPTPYGAPGDAAPGTENPGDISDPHGMLTAEQLDPPLGPYPDPPSGPYPDPVPKEPAPPEEPAP